MSADLNRLRGLAERWAKGAASFDLETLDEWERATEEMSDAELDELLVGVRDEMAREVEQRRNLRVLARQQTARDVADQYDVRSDANHDALTLRIASALGIDEGVARALCEAAGWPS